MRSDSAISLRESEVDWALGPGSVSWKVMRNPAVFIVGILREAILLTLHLPFAAAATDHDGVHEDPVKRFGTVARYAYSTVYGSKTDAERVAGFVRRRHNQIVGTEPTSGDHYQANSDYELALTQVLLSSSWIAAYEAMFGRLSHAERDQFHREQQVGGTLIGIKPSQLPASHAEMEAWLGRARLTWAAGLQAREILRPFASGVYPPGSVIGSLPGYYRRPLALVVRLFTDMTLLTMHPDELELLSIPRPLTLRSRLLTHRAMLRFAAFMGSERGTKAFDKLVKSDVAKIIRRSKAAEAAAGGHEAAAPSFEVPDASALAIAVLQDRVENFPAVAA